ncbi:Hypothetical protein GbCGDNIH1_1558 [Granulibacter bethesdensis CGDNIH1]|uniref:Secreted protein n=2 Tax=Granulibacter bethesdensis TaxID=364410 RepID=Q0BRU6_GRABC|nr:Hypothetical protein GbCGDNIH1_1558 [Granulibacter bethesdensis CGDNIH1]APH52294.1 Hypothetical protein GbCGDNIH5_1558 [Granulibacter bethesdensis]APH64988.1 Hypothetical protein GbCGDNIH1I4_1558 [Granulibacter bethesdensis]
MYQTMKYKTLVIAAVLLGNVLSCGSAVADYWDPGVMAKLSQALEEEKERRRKHNEAIESKLTPEILEKLRQKYDVPPGPYHLYRGEEEASLIQSFGDKLQRRNPNISWSDSHMTVNEQGDWFVCMVTEEILKNHIPRNEISIKSSRGWTLYDDEFGGKFLFEIHDKACLSDGEVVK